MSHFARMSACPGEAVAEMIVMTRFSTPVTATRVTRNRFGKTHVCSQLDFEAQHGEGTVGSQGTSSNAAGERCSTLGSKRTGKSGFGPLQHGP